MDYYQVVEFNGKKYAEVLRANAKVNTTRFFSAPDSSFQFGLLAHNAGFVEKPHYHREMHRVISDLQQMFLVQRGVVAVDLFDNDGNLIDSIILVPGDAIVLIQGIHSIRVLEDMQCVSIKQGPFLGVEFDKVEVDVSQ